MPLALLNTRLNCIEIGNEAATNPGEKTEALAVTSQLVCGVATSFLTWSVNKVSPFSSVSL